MKKQKHQAMKGHLRLCLALRQLLGEASHGAGPLTCHLSAQMLEVGTNTRVRDVCEGIATRLQLASWEGCSLFIKISDKVCWPGRPRNGRQGSCVVRWTSA